jgi:hypothetical protein
MPLTVTELSAGIAYWRNTSWPQDFHSAFYSRMQAATPQGRFTQDWWNCFLPELTKWRALRPKSPSFVTSRVSGRFQRLSQAWVECMTEDVLTSDIAQVEWARVAPFVEIVSEIKDVASPVFPSKFCHFLAPRIFPVIDNAAMGNSFHSYKVYYKTAQAEWVQTPDHVRTNLISVFARDAGIKHTSNYPIKCKIVELCLIGRNQIKQASR